MGIKELLQERNIKLEYKDGKDVDFSELEGNAIITNDDTFTRNLLLNAGLNEFHVVSEASIETAEQIKKQVDGKYVVGFGGGKALDIAKKIAFDLNLELISIPTAPSHDGLLSKNCSLYNGKRRETIPAKYPSKVIIPGNLWKNSGNLKKAGICDLLSNLTALQDISLGEKNGENFMEFYKKLSCDAAEKADCKDEKELAHALILSGIAMEKTSRYCSGSEHEVERLLESHINDGAYLHGQLAGTGALISAKVYEIYSSKLQNLKFDSGKLFELLKEKMMKLGVYEFAVEPLKNEKFNPNLLKEVSKVRPERYTLWNVVDSKEVVWDRVIGEILKTDDRFL